MKVMCCIWVMWLSGFHVELWGMGRFLRSSMMLSMSGFGVGCGEELQGVCCLIRDERVRLMLDRMRRM